jgi:hypothetical protein
MRVTAFLLVTFYAAMVLAGYIVEIVFGILGLIPETRNATVLEETIRLNYTSVLNIVFLALAAALVIRAVRTGVVPMLKMMNVPPSDEDVHQHDGSSVTSSHDGTTYTCPMHPEIVRAEPGRCPKCGMELIPQRTVPSG